MAASLGVGSFNQNHRHNTINHQITQRLVLFQLLITGLGLHQVSPNLGSMGQLCYIELRVVWNRTVRNFYCIFPKKIFWYCNFHDISDSRKLFLISGITNIFQYQNMRYQKITFQYQKSDFPIYIRNKLFTDIGIKNFSTGNSEVTVFNTHGPGEHVYSHLNELQRGC